MSRTDQEYPRRGCAIGSEITPTTTPVLIETEPDALFQFWRKMAKLSLEAEPVDLGKLEFCVRRMAYWREHTVSQ